MSNVYHHLLRLFLKTLPESRYFKLVSWIYNQIGYKIARDARLFSSVKILGEIELNIGSNTFIGANTFIAGGKSKITIGSNCDISSNAQIVSGSHEFDLEGERLAGKGFSKDIQIDDGVWIGNGAIILGGVKIGKKSMIAAGAVVTNDIPSKVVAGGVPARIIKRFGS